MQHRARGSKSPAKDRRLEKSTAWMAESQLDEKEMDWQQYLHSLRDRCVCESIFIRFLWIASSAFPTTQARRT